MQVVARYRPEQRGEERISDSVAPRWSMAWYPSA
jgi:hypothetical protein